MIIDFTKKQEMNIDDKKAIAQIVMDGFWGKMGKFLESVSSNEAVDIIEDAITFNKGFYYKEDGVVLGVTLLATEEITYINFLKSRRKRVGFWDSLFLHIGFGLMAPKKKDGLKLEMIAVSPKARGKGVGTKMLDYLNSIAVKDGFKKLTLEVIDSNNKAKVLYEKKGYRDIKYTNTSLFTKSMGFNGYYKMQKIIE